MPQPIARMETLTPVRPRVRRGICAAASAGPVAAISAGMAATAPTIEPLCSRNSRRLIRSCIDMIHSCDATCAYEALTPAADRYSAIVFA